MMRPEFYPAPCAKVELKETHISWVFLAGDQVYKVKKPVRFPFINCSTLNRRYHLCTEEVRLNSRLTLDVYLGVFPILRQGDSFILGPRAEGVRSDAVEYAVKMRRLPEERTLDHLVAAGSVDRVAIRSLGVKLADFHASVPAEHGWKFGRASELQRALAAERREFEPFIGDTLDAGQLSEIDDFYRAFIAPHRKLLDWRAKNGRVREGHGDLRAEHVFLERDRTNVIDCIEFNERLRYCDVASEIAFLAMDLERLDAPALADELVEAYAKAADDPEMPQLAPFYKCYRACVRGKVESLRSRASETASGAREQARSAARRYFAQASYYARIGAPALIVVCGLSGTGKSTIARLLQGRTGFEITSSDATRKRLADVAPNQRMRARYAEGIYSQRFSVATYQAMLDEAEKSLKEGRGVIMDATFKRAPDRERATALAKNLGVPILFVECVASPREVIRRLARRSDDVAEVSDATAEVYEVQAGEFTPFSQTLDSHHVRADTERDRGRLASEIETALENALRHPSQRKQLSGG